jgi:uncharacterized membrane protein
MAYLPAPTDRGSTADPTEKSAPFIRRHLLAIVAAVLGVAFLAAPWPFEVKAHAVLHGICGQTPSHTMTFGGMELPLDSRCVGIFGGMLVTFLLLLGLGRARAAALPSAGAGIVLLGFLAVMALDGLNSLMTDLERWHPYAPSNDLRLLTGWTAGVCLGTMLLMVTGMTLWERPKTSMRVLPSWWWPMALLAPFVPAWLLLRTGATVAYYPASLILIASAISAFGALAVCSIVMLRNRDNTFVHVSQLQQLAAAGVLIAVTILLAMSGGRFWIERTFGLVSPG